METTFKLRLRYWLWIGLVGFLFIAGSGEFFLSHWQKIETSRIEALIEANQKSLSRELSDYRKQISEYIDKNNLDGAFRFEWRGASLTATHTAVPYLPLEVDAPQADWVELLSAPSDRGGAAVYVEGAAMVAYSGRAIRPDQNVIFARLMQSPTSQVFVGMEGSEYAEMSLVSLLQTDPLTHVLIRDIPGSNLKLLIHEPLAPFQAELRWIMASVLTIWFLLGGLLLGWTAVHDRREQVHFVRADQLLRHFFFGRFDLFHRGLSHPEMNNAWMRAFTERAKGSPFLKFFDRPWYDRTSKLASWNTFQSVVKGFIVDQNSYFVCALQCQTTEHADRVQSLMGKHSDPNHYLLRVDTTRILWAGSATTFHGWTKSSVRTLAAVLDALNGPEFGCEGMFFAQGDVHGEDYLMQWVTESRFVRMGRYVLNDSQNLVGVQSLDSETVLAMAQTLQVSRSAPKVSELGIEGEVTAASALAAMAARPMISQSISQFLTAQKTEGLGDSQGEGGPASIVSRD